MAKVNPGKKVTMNASVSLGTKQEVDRYGSSPKYGTSSNFIESAVNFYLGSLHQEKIHNQELEIEKLKEAVKELKNKNNELTAENKRYTDLFFKMVSRHPDILTEITEEPQGKTGSK